MKFWTKKKDIAEEITDDLKKVTEVAGDQIAPGMGTMLLVVAAAVAAGAGAYYVSQRRRQKKAKKP
jgi:uncharacterized protein HemX